MQAIEQYKFVLKVQKLESGMGAGGIAFGWDSHRKAFELPCIAIGSEYAGFYPRDYKYTTRIEEK